MTQPSSALVIIPIYGHLPVSWHSKLRLDPRPNTKVLCTEHKSVEDKIPLKFRDGREYIKNHKTSHLWIMNIYFPSLVRNLQWQSCRIYLLLSGAGFFAVAASRSCSWLSRTSTLWSDSGGASGGTLEVHLEAAVPCMA